MGSGGGAGYSSLWAVDNIPTGTRLAQSIGKKVLGLNVKIAKTSDFHVKSQNYFPNGLS